MIKKDKLVNIPDRKVYIQKKNAAEYVYYRVEFYRNSDKKSRCKSQCIGIRYPETQKMWPNKNYYELFGDRADCESFNEVKTEDLPCSSNSPSCDVFSIGFTAVIAMSFIDLRLDRILIDEFGEDLYKKLKLSARI